jgi:hypothetical protein
MHRYALDPLTVAPPPIPPQPLASPNAPVVRSPFQPVPVSHANGREALKRSRSGATPSPAPAPAPGASPPTPAPVSPSDSPPAAPPSPAHGPTIVPLVESIQPEPLAPPPPQSGRALKRAREAEARSLATLLSVHGKSDWIFSLRRSDGTVLWEGTEPSVCLVARRDRLAEIDPATVELRLQSDVAVVHSTNATVHAQRVGKLCQSGGTLLVQHQIGGP